MTSSALSIEKFHNEQLWVLTLHASSQQAVDAWEATVRDYIQQVDHRPERYLVYDLLSVPNLGFTNYLRYRATELAKDNREATGRVAIVAHLHPTINHFFTFFLRTTGARIQPRLSIKMLATRPQAMAWVEEILPSTLQEKTT